MLYNKNVKRIKESITEKEYKRLMSFVRGNESYRNYKRMNLLRTFCILFYSGMRINEIRDLNYGHIYDLLQNKNVIIKTQKTNNERKIYLSKTFEKELKKLFPIKKDRNEPIIYNDRKKISKNANNSFVITTNSAIKEILGERFTSHSFRQGLLTEMGSKGVNPKLIMNFVGHKNINTTMRYIKPTDEDIMNSLVR